MRVSAIITLLFSALVAAGPLQDPKGQPDTAMMKRQDPSNCPDSQTAACCAGCLVTSPFDSQTGRTAASCCKDCGC
ncbi:hypothetical protein ASPFODRAFT_45477 [Aspergillus luchuensis CBS 106.47]|uniref:Uncharacterized protein n=1 Tax=Aspergillus luchuensis (strain CBS 106.47) TaxID=1137211 RepID=A0A1M3TM24_ASPLC|nr:hypothetical protein ASPFODRAFT_45477 [Aspergillus luchuensis CBS 106.47]